MFKYIYILICLYIIMQSVYSETMSKSEVLQIKLKRTNSKKCPSYSEGYKNFFCQYRFFCRGEFCSTKNKRSSVVEFKNADGKTERFIPDTCTEEGLRIDLCHTAKCYEDSDCLSNKCINRTCIVNEAYPITQCVNMETYNTLEFKYTAEMNCGLSENEKCELNEDCASRNCTDTGHCLYHYVDHKFDQIFYQIFEIGVLLFIVVVIVLVICCLACCYRHKKRKAKFTI